MGTEVIGAEATIAAIGTHVADFNARLNSVIQYVGQEAEGVAADLAAVDTGLMRASIAYTPGDLYAEVHDYVFYSVYVDQGIGQRPQPFMTPAYDQGQADLLRLVQTL